MTEDFLHYIWKRGLYSSLAVNRQIGENIEVLSSGEMNSNAGPDFFNAIIRIGGTIFAGNVEIHVNSSDWYRHGHHHDRAYDNVILQLVLNRDTEVRRTTGDIIPTAVLSFDIKLQENYRHLLGNESWIPCQPWINQVDPALAGGWLDEMVILRIEEKAHLVGEIRHYNNNCWEESFYQQLARNFGFRLNGAVFEMLARSLPYKFLLRHRDDLFQLEAMLFGQAGMLCENEGDEYFMALKKEYSFLKSKYRLKPLEKHLWRFLRLRPANFPTVRLSQFAALLHEKTSLFSSVLNCRDIESLSSLFRISSSEYWDTHFLFSKPSSRHSKSIGVFAIRSLIINTVVPVLYFYGKNRQIEEYSKRAIDFLKALPPENNSVITSWSALGIRAGNAFQSQALMQLKNEFCSYRRCLDCSIGNHIINVC